MRGKKPFDKIQYPFRIKALESLGMEGVYLNKIKAAYDQPNPALYGMLRNTSSSVVCETDACAFQSFPWWCWDSRKAEIKPSLSAEDAAV